MSESYNKLVMTLRSIFEMDKADLDFGIYRIMNQKRDDVMRFLEEDLLGQVNAAFKDYAGDSKADVQEELNKLIQTLADAGMNPDESPKVSELKNQLSSSVDVRSVENEVYSHLHKFFSRYYDKGDFISQRRYKNDAYAIPYEGEEVKLYWANHDQYYIKSSEHLRDYAFLAQEEGGEKSVRIKLVEADTEKDNVKARSGEERRFVLDEENPLSVEDGELHIHFHYIPVGKKKQEKLNEEAVKVVFAQEGFDEWLELLGQKAPTEKNPNRTVLEKHLNDYTARNTFDYFIHKDLSGFLRRELDFYIKNEVFHLDDIDDAAFEVTEQHLRKIKVLRTIAHKIIRMLAQLEDFQKKLWLKKKFVVETNYCITVDRLAEHTDFLEQVFENADQLEEWKNLFALDLEKLEQDYENMDWEEFLAQPEYQYLVLDTKFFDQSFKDKVIATIDDLDEQCDGILVQSENFQALKLLEPRYKGQIRATYIDPPYNTVHSEIIYKNQYKHSSWLSLMANVARITPSFWQKTFSFGLAIDDYEFVNLASLLDGLFPSLERSIAVVNHHPQGSGGRLSRTHEYLILCASPDAPPYMGAPKGDYIEQRNFMRSGTGENNFRYGRWKSFYALIIDPKTNQIIDAEPPVPLGEEYPTDNTPEGYQRRYPVNSRNEERVWRSSYVTGKERAQNGELGISDRGAVYQIIDHEGKREMLFSNWTDSKFNAGTHGSNLLVDFGLGGEFDYPKSVFTVETALWAQTFGDPTAVVMDYFAGSATTSHAVINLNRSDKGKRKYILVEMGRHFDTVTKPRTQKSIYSATWENGKPISNDSGVSHCFKYICLESYEDTLNNLILNQSTNRQGEMLQAHETLREDYMLGYMLDVETSDSPSLLNIDQFEDPFNYKLNIGSGSVGATKAVTVDLVETFNYLIGLTVKHIDTLRSFKVVTGTNPQDESVLVIWRNVKEQDNAALEAFMDKQGYNPKDTEYARIYVNGDHTLEDPQSKVKMTEIEFKRLMFDVQDV